MASVLEAISDDGDAVFIKVYLITVFVGALFLWDLLGNDATILSHYVIPATSFEFIFSTALTSAFVFFVVAFLICPELHDWPRYRRRSAYVAAAISSALVVVVSYYATPLFLARVINDIGVGIVLVVYFGGIVPCVVVARLAVHLCPGRCVAQRGDHYIDVSALSEDTYRIVQKHTNGTFRKPPGWGKDDELVKDRRLTHTDLGRMIELETAEQEQLRQLALAQTEALKADTDRACAEHSEALDPSVHVWMDKQAQALAESELGLEAARRREAELLAQCTQQQETMEQLWQQNAALARELAERGSQLIALAEARTQDATRAAATEQSLTTQIKALEVQLLALPRSRGAPPGGWKYPDKPYPANEPAKKKRS